MKTQLKAVPKALPKASTEPRRVLLTPEMAGELLEANQHNRPLSDAHVNRIAAQIASGRWRFNGDTIKIAEGGDVLDGQHRLWAIIEAKTPVETILIHGIAREAFATIDTIRKSRSLGDTVALSGTTRHRSMIGAALAWLIRWQRHTLENYKAPQNRVENSDVERALLDNPGIIPAVERAAKLRAVANPALIAFLYYLVVNRNAELADRMFETLKDPAGVGINDPFFRLRGYFTADHHKRKEPLVTIAIAIKAINAAAVNSRVHNLHWRQQGRTPEEFPTLKV